MREAGSSKIEYQELKQVETSLHKDITKERLRTKEIFLQMKGKDAEIGSQEGLVHKLTAQLDQVREELQNTIGSYSERLKKQADGRNQLEGKLREK